MPDLEAMRMPVLRARCYNVPEKKGVSPTTAGVLVGMQSAEFHVALHNRRDVRLAS